MKKIGASLILLLLVFSFVPLAFADNHTTNTSTTTTTSSSDDDQSEKEKIDEGFECLEDKVDDCSGLTNQEIALTIMATPKDEVFDDCVEELEGRKASNHWGNVRDTALAVIALQHAGKDTEEAEEWLLSKARIPTDLIWYIEQDSDGETECNIQYTSNDHTINIGENKKIDRNAGTCLTRARSNFWLEVSNSCYDEEFKMACNKDFLATLLYENKNYPTVYVLEGTQRATGLSGTVTLQINSKCVGDSSCDYEATVWTTLALLETGHDVKDFIPYIVAMAESNQRYLPNAFIYPITDYEDYASKLIQEQSTGFFWLADNSAYNKFYDSSLALLSLTSSSSEQVSKARDWLLYPSTQAQNGCWGNSIRDTAIVLWALTGRSGRSSGGGGVTYCSEANYFCIHDSECPSDQELSNYFCSGSGKTCCRTENLLSCSEYGGQTCESGKVCTGNEKKALDTGACCVGECIERGSSFSECEDLFHTCKTSCSDNQEEVDYSCDGQGVCCKPKTASEPSYWWIWLLLILILIVLGVIGWIYREKLKVLLFKLKTKFKKDKGRKGGAAPLRPRPGMPPRPGFPPIRRAAPVGAPRKRGYDRRDKEMSDTFRKLREMSK
jgi:hypothetical protein